jgi:CBS domain-containing protein
MTSDPISLGDTQISNLLGGEVVCISPDATIFAAAKALDGASVGAVVIGDLAEVIGIVSERDVIRAVAEQKELESALATSIASTKIVRCETTSTVTEVALQMMDRYVRHVLVEEDGRFVGIVSARDLLAVFISNEFM